MAHVKGNGKRNFLAACCDCFPSKTLPAPTSPPYRSTRYNSRVRENLNLPQYPLKLPTYVENIGGVITTQPHRTPRPSMDVVSQSDPSEPRRSAQHPRLPLSVNVSGSDDPRARWSSSVLRTSQLIQLFDTIAATLEHVPYAICGLGALIDHGFIERRLSRVSVLCPAHSKDNVRGWLAARGYETYADSVGIPIANGDMTVRMRIKYVPQGFEKFERVKSSMSQAWILGLASQLDHCAAGFMDSYRRFQKLEEEKGNGKDPATRASLDADEEVQVALNSIAQDVFWCLEKAARTHHHLDPKYLPTLMGEEFWTPFSKRNASAWLEFSRAGINVNAMVAKQKDVAFKRDHKALLKEYNVEARGSGGDDDDTDETRSAFDGMRPLTRNKSNPKSVYTHYQALSPRDSTPATPITPLSRRKSMSPSFRGLKGRSVSRSLSRGKGKLDNFVSNLLKKPNSDRDVGKKKPPTPGTPGIEGYNYGLTRSNSENRGSHETLKEPQVRFSVDSRRPTKWV
ncbi:hypothetical protein F5Y04DRAFT_291747 [Hypomontagnella monticulosa]|nr:hypothetical protein F5Y04DRAFT_291747 [Hypomontagnella monticulosa]